MKLKYIDNSLLFENILLEDKQVKFDGEVDPKYGWCVIYAGGPASGKSTAANFNVPIVGKRLDVDEFKSLEKKLQILSLENKPRTVIEPGFVKKFEGGKYYKEILNSPKIAGDERKMSMQNPNYVEAAHQALDPLMDKLKASMKSIGQYNNPERLPNIIFDQTSKNANKVLRIANEVKQYGYKVAVIWVLTDLKQNLDAFKERGKEGRKMDVKLFIDIHPKVFNAMMSIFENPQMLASIDEFWVIHNTYMKTKTALQQKRQIQAANVYHVPLVPDGLKKVNLVQETGIKHKGKQKRKTLWDLIQQGLNFLPTIPEEDEE